MVTDVLECVWCVVEDCGMWKIMRVDATDPVRIKLSIKVLHKKVKFCSVHFIALLVVFIFFMM